MSTVSCFVMSNTIVFSIYVDIFEIILSRQFKAFYFFGFRAYIFSITFRIIVCAATCSACARIICAYRSCRTSTFCHNLLFFILQS